jgi:hypothetical protein
MIMLDLDAVTEVAAATLVRPALENGVIFRNGAFDRVLASLTAAKPATQKHAMDVLETAIIAEQRAAGYMEE